MRKGPTRYKIGQSGVSANWKPAAEVVSTPLDIDKINATPPIKAGEPLKPGELVYVRNSQGEIETIDFQALENEH